MKDIILPQELIDRLKSEIKEEILGDIEKSRLDSIESIQPKFDFKIDSVEKRIDRLEDKKPQELGVIEGSLKDIIELTNKKDEEFYKNVAFNPQVRSDIKDEVLKKIQIPKDGEDGKTGAKGKKGEDGKDYKLDEKDRVDIAAKVDLSDIVSEDDFNIRIKNIVSEFNKKIRRANGGLSGQEMIKEFNKILDTDDWQNGLPGDLSLPANLSYVQFDTTLGIQPHSEGLLQYDKANKTLLFYNDEEDSSLQIGQEIWLRGKNNTGSTITNGQLVYINDNDAGLPTFTLAKADAAVTAIGTIAFATHDIEDGTIGLATRTGTVRALDTTGCTAGQILWLSATTAGAFTPTQPNSPNFSVSVGNCGVVNATTGTIEANINAGGNTRDVIKIFNGAILEDHAITISSNGTVVTLTLEKNGGGNLSLFFDGLFSIFDTTPAASVTLTAGSDTAPTLNFIYIPKSTKVLTANTTGFPVNEQVVPIAEVIAQSAASLQTDGCYKCHAWTDHLSDSVDQGHVSHVNKWIRKQHSTWLSGVAPTTSITVNGGAIDNVFYSNNSGNILQLHEHSFPAIDMSTGAPIFVVNDATTAFRRATDLNTLDETSLGVTLRSNNTYYSIVVWGVISEGGTDSKIFANLPTGSYANSTDAITDPFGFSNFTIPSDFKGTGFLIARIVLRFQTVSSGTITEISTIDLRGLLPSTGAGSSGGAGGTEFSDNLFRIQNVADNTKEIDYDASAITTATTRTITMPDRNIDLSNVPDGAIKTGATQVAAGAAAGEPWATASHATLPDNVILIGV